MLKSSLENKCLKFPLKKKVINRNCGNSNTSSSVLIGSVLRTSLGSGKEGGSRIQATCPHHFLIKKEKCFYIMMAQHQKEHVEMSPIHKLDQRFRFAMGTT